MRDDTEILPDRNSDADVVTAGLRSEIDLPGYQDWLDARGDSAVTTDDIAWADAMDRQATERIEQLGRGTSKDGRDRSAA
jgi:hypothetical protein